MSNSIYDVQPIPGDEGASRRFDKFLPPVPFSGLFVAQKGDGKTTVIANLVEMYQERLGIKAFNQIFPFSSTIFTDQKWRYLLDKGLIRREDCQDSFNESVVKDIFEKIRRKNSNVQNHKKKSYLFIFDDLADQFPRGQKENILKTFCYNHRNFFISFLLVSQKYTELPNYARCNPSFWILFRNNNNGEHKAICNEVRGHLSMKEFEKIFMKATEKRYSFLFVDYSYNHDVSMKYRCKFNGMIDNGMKQLTLKEDESDGEDNELAEEIKQNVKDAKKNKLDNIKIKKPRNSKKESKDNDDEEDDADDEVLEI